MAFVTTFTDKETNTTEKAYNIDFSVGAGKANLRADIMLVQALFRILHFEVSNPPSPPKGETDIEVDGRLTSATLRFILNAQLLAKAKGGKVLVDGTFDPFREHNQRSLIAHVFYVLEIVNNSCRTRCLKDGSNAYAGLPLRTDIPAELVGELNLPTRKVAGQYQKTPF